MADQVDAIIAGLDRFTEHQVISLTLEVTATLIEDTPRDTGWARSNWVPSIGASVVVGDEVQTPTPANVAGARSRQQQGQSSVLSYKLHQGRTFVTNGVPYIQKLNDGWSKQAPAAFVQASVAKAVKVVAARGDAA